MIKDLIPNDSAHLKALLAGDRVDNHVAVYTDKMLAVEYSILILASCINDLDRKVLVFVSNDFAEGVLDRGVVGVDEMAVNVLNREGALAYDMLSQKTQIECIQAISYRQTCCRQWPSCVVSAAAP